MADGSGLETHEHSTNGTASGSAGESATQAPPRATGLRRTILFIVIAAASAGLAYAIVRATLTRAPVDPTTERIQSLIDEANRLLKQLDDKKSG